MNGLDIRITPIDLVLKHCRVHTVQLTFGSIRACISITNEAAFGGTFLIFKELSPLEADAVLRGNISISLLSEKRGVVGIGKGSNISLPLLENFIPAAAELSPTFTLLGETTAEIALIHEVPGKTNLELGSMQVELKFYSLALVKECPHKCLSPVTEKERFVSPKYS